MYTIQELCSRGRKVDTSRLTLEPEKILWKQGDVKNEEQLLKQRSRQISAVCPRTGDTAHRWADGRYSAGLWL